MNLKKFLLVSSAPFLLSGSTVYNFNPNSDDFWTRLKKDRFYQKWVVEPRIEKEKRSDLIFDLAGEEALDEAKRKFLRVAKDYQVLDFDNEGVFIRLIKGSGDVVVLSEKDEDFHRVALALESYIINSQLYYNGEIASSPNYETSKPLI